MRVQHHGHLLLRLDTRRPSPGEDSGKLPERVLPVPQRSRCGIGEVDACFRGVEGAECLGGQLRK